MEASREISLKLKELAKIKRKIRQNKICAFHLSMEDPQDFDSNPFQEEINELQLQEILILQEIQQNKRQIQTQYTFYFSPLIQALEAA